MNYSTWLIHKILYKEKVNFWAEINRLESEFPFYLPYNV